MRCNNLLMLTSSVQHNLPLRRITLHCIERQVSWDQSLQQLLFSPIEEQAQLREASLFPPVTAPTPLPTAAGSKLELGSWPQTSAGNQSEVEATFMLPATSAKFGVVVMGGGNSSSSNMAATSGGMLFYVDYLPPPGVDARNGDGDDVYTVVVGTESLSGGSGIGGTTDLLRLHKNETSVTIRVFVDNTMAEGYWQRGRVAMSTLVTPTVQSSMSAARISGGNVTLASAQGWTVGSIWVSADDVLSSATALKES